MKSAKGSRSKNRAFLTIFTSLSENMTTWDNGYQTVFLKALKDNHHLDHSSKMEKRIGHQRPDFVNDISLMVYSYLVMNLINPSNLYHTLL
jgi:hypothetical protein